MKILKIALAQCRQTADFDANAETIFRWLDEAGRAGAQIVFHPQNNTTRPNDWKIPIHQAMIVTRAAENTIWFASCNACLTPHQNCRSLVVAPDGTVAAQSELQREQLVVADIDIDRATRAMFRYDLNACAELLFADAVRREEFASALSQVADDSQHLCDDSQHL